MKHKLKTTLLTTLALVSITGAFLIGRNTPKNAKSENEISRIMREARLSQED